MPTVTETKILSGIARIEESIKNTNGNVEDLAHTVYGNGTEGLKTRVDRIEQAKLATEKQIKAESRKAENRARVHTGLTLTALGAFLAAFFKLLAILALAGAAAGCTRLVVYDGEGRKVVDRWRPPFVSSYVHVRIDDEGIYIEENSDTSEVGAKAAQETLQSALALAAQAARPSLPGGGP